MSQGQTVQFSWRNNPATAPGIWYIPNESGSTYNTAIATITDSSSAPATDMSVGRFVLANDKPMSQIAFHLTNADNETMAFTVFGMRKYRGSTISGYSATALVSGVATAGSKVFNGGSFLWADTVSITTASLPTSAYRTCNTTNDVGWLEVDMRDYEYIVVVGTRNGQTCDSFNVLFGNCTL